MQWLFDAAEVGRVVPPPGTARHLAHPSLVAETWIDEFDGITIEVDCFVLTMHPWIVGRPSRIAPLDRVVAHIQRRSDVWWTAGAALWPGTSWPTPTTSTKSSTRRRCRPANPSPATS